MADPSPKKAKSPPPQPARSRQRSDALARSRNRAARSRSLSVKSKSVKTKALAANAKTIRNWPIAPWLVGSGLLLGIGLVGSSVWLGIQLIVDPNSLSWANRFLPDSMQIPLSDQRPSQTLAEIRAELQALDLRAGDAILLPVKNRLLAGNDAHLLIPVRLQEANCQHQCQQIVELRVYQPTQTMLLPGQDKTYRLVSQVAVQGIEEGFALAGPPHRGIAPSQSSRTSGQSPSRLLPLTDLQAFPDKVPAAGVWLYLSGQRRQGERTIAYGHVVHYNPDQTFLNLMLQWTSATGELPTWQAVTGGDPPELVVDGSVSLEPRFQVFQLEPLSFPPDPLQLRRIALEEPVLKQSSYQKAMQLARSGLWSDALRLLQSLKTQKSVWSAAAQAQMDLVQLHAQVAQAQAIQDWVSLDQKLLAQLMDGRWNEALQAIQANPDQLQSAFSMLNANADALLGRVETSLTVNPARSNAKIWGALILAAQKDRSQAMNWLRQQPGNAGSTLAITHQLLSRLETANLTAAIPPHASQIIGAAQSLKQVNFAGWQSLEKGKTLKPSEGQSWYQIEVARFHDGKRWLKSPFKLPRLSQRDTAAYLWPLLGLNSDAQITLLVWTEAGQQAISATVKAVRHRNGQLWLLAASTQSPELPLAGEAQPTQTRPKPLAFTEQALNWVTPNTIMLADLSQQQPQKVAAMVPALWRELQRAGYIAVADTPSLEVKLQRLGSLPAQQIDLTGNQQPDSVIRIEAAVLANWRKEFTRIAKLTRSRTVIFSAGGRLLYSEFSGAAEQFSVVAIAALSDGGLPVLVSSGPQNYSLKRWSTPNQRFE